MESEQEQKQEVREHPKIDEYKKIVKELKEENKRIEDNIAVLQALKVETMLGGKTTAGQQPEQKKEESNEEYAKRVLRGEV